MKRERKDRSVAVSGTIFLVFCEVYVNFNNILVQFQNKKAFQGTSF